MYTALYYPHTRVVDETILKTALLLWDRLEYVAPYKDFEPEPASYSIDEARELVTRPHIPTQSEKESVHGALESILERGIPDWFRFQPTLQESPYLIWPQKFLRKSWTLLEESEFATFDQASADMATANPMGLWLMSMLADSCAGYQKRTVTDQVDSYATLTRFLTDSYEGTYGDIGAEYERLATITIEILDVDRIELEALIELRRREEKEASGQSLTDLRHNYLQKIDAYVSRLAKEAMHESDRLEIERQFREEMKKSLADLKDELRETASDAALSKEVAVGVLAAAGIPLQPITAPAAIIGVGALLKARSRYKRERKKVLQNHAMAWLTELGRRGSLSIY